MDEHIQNKTKRLRRLYHWEIIVLYLVIYDILAVNVAYFGALMLRFDFIFSRIPLEYFSAFLKFAPIYTILTLIVFYLIGLYKSLWRFASFNELNRILAASVITTIIHVFGITVFVQRMPISYYMVGAVAQTILITGVRFAYRYINLLRARRWNQENAKHNVMVIGAGMAGQILLKELTSSSKIELRPCCVIDDNPNKWGRLIEGIPIVGGRDKILDSVDKYQIEKILLAIPTAKGIEKKKIIDICQQTKCELMSLPGIYQLANGDVSLKTLKPVAVEDLLGRDQVEVNMDEIRAHIKGKKVLVTGGGGSIGSELCRQIASYEPKQLIVFDIYENNAYELQQDLKRKYGDSLELIVLIGSVRDARRLEKVFEKYRPELVYHAAAHKHVPLMENSPNEAIKNNVFGTYKTAYTALKYGVERFVLISTDKAVNPVNVMGASKRLCEMVIQSVNTAVKSGKVDTLPIFAGMKPIENKDNAKTQFVAVRFGNVLGSNGSVIPLFKKQIAEGGPVTVTHPDVVRYFMTIPEASHLVLQAGTYAEGGEIFVLEMGEMVKIDDMARSLIKLSGLVPDEDIEIKYTGLRDGEKLYEEKFMVEEGVRTTANEKIYIGKPIDLDINLFFKQLAELEEECFKDGKNVIPMVEELVPTFTVGGR